MTRWTRLRQLARTSAIRLALRYAALQIALLALALAALFWATDRYVEQQVATSLQAELAVLRSLPAPALAARLTASSDVRSGLHPSRHYLLLDARGARLAGDINGWPRWLHADGRLANGPISLLESADDGDDPADVLEALHLSAIGDRLAGGRRLLIAQEPGAAEDLREYALLAAMVVLGLVAGMAVVLGLALGWQWLARIDAINRTAGRIAEGDLSQRVASSGRGDEFDLLATHLNAMLERIEHAVSGMREVSDNVAHDLRRPLSRLKTRIEVTLAQGRSAEEYRDSLLRTAVDADELIRTFDALLSIARLEAGSEIPAPERFDLVELTDNVTALYADEAEDAGRPFGVGAPPTLPVRGQPPLLARALANLLDNAFRHSAATVPVEVLLQCRDGQAVLAVIDHGAGIAAAERDRMTERFARGDTARQQPGSGLGLALVKAVAQAHRGRLELTETPGGGLTVRVWLPSA